MSGGLAAMRFLTSFQPPDELEMLDRGFGISSDHDPEEAILSYVRTYDGGTELNLKFEIGFSSTIYASIKAAGAMVSEFTVVDVSYIEFQSWHGERIFRVRFNPSPNAYDLRIHYDPSPNIHFSNR